MLALTRNGQGEFAASPVLRAAPTYSRSRWQPEIFFVARDLVQIDQFFSEAAGFIRLQEVLTGSHIAVINARVLLGVIRKRQIVPLISRISKVHAQASSPP